ncbi:MAG TPA: NAD(P)/FAD-dependent oxidoreductase [Burkholderiales bacterium]|nr:NAD(P)/FAD-dependent oxidoreductase [Burkholderiales bacterium]
MRRRDFLKIAGAVSLAGCAGTSYKARVVVVGGGFGGATAAKYLRLWDPSIEVILVERANLFTSCPLSNLVLAGFATMDDIRRPYDGLRRHGVQVVNDEVVAIDAARKLVRLGRGGDVSYDRLIVSPGIDFAFGEVEGYEEAMQAGRVLHAWKAGPQTVGLRRQIEQMRDGGVFVLSIPEAPYRCPPGPYERASLVAEYFKLAKPRSKVLVLDANPDLTSKAGLFRAAWKDYYGGVIEYRPNSKAVGFDAATATLKLEVEDVKGDVFNVIPPHGAGNIARKAGLVTTNNRWCDIDWRSMESKAVPDVHVLGDSTLAAPALPKSASMANNQGKLAAAAIADLLRGRAPMEPRILNTCYSFVSQKEAVHVASVHAWDDKDRTIKPVPGAGGLSAARSEIEGTYAWSWARSIWADSLA